MTTVHFPPPEVLVMYCGFDFASDLSENPYTIYSPERLTESIKSLHKTTPALLPKGILVQALVREAVHRFFQLTLFRKNFTSILKVLNE
jgi:hypothetical protein